MAEAEDDRAGKRKVWLIVLCVSLTLLAIFWSVDPSIFYILTGFSAFCFYKVLQNRNLDSDESEFKKTYQQQKEYYPKPSFWDELKFVFSNKTASRSPGNQNRLVKLVIAIFVGLIFLSVIIPILFSDGSPSDYYAHQTGKDFYDRQEYDSAIYYYGIAIKNEPDNPDLYLERGNAFLNADKLDSAMLDYEKTLSIDPDYEGAVHGKGLVYYNRKQYKSAIEAGELAVSLNPECNDARLLVGDGFYNSSQLDSAMRWYEEAYAKGYRSAGLSHVMAYIYDNKGQTQKAIPLYKEAISYDTTRTNIYGRLGELIPGEEGNVYRQKAAQYPR